MQVIIARKIKAPVVMYVEATEYLELYIMKLAMIAIYNDPQYKALDCHMVITVHDELIMEVPEDHIKEGADLLVNTMKRVGHSLIDLPMSVDAEVNDYWYGENLADEYLEEE